MISVIVPVFNAGEWLRRCVDSILAQTYTDFELLLVDDGSTDAGGAICDEYARKDARIRVFHKPNGGVSSARNIGLDSAVGEWITFCDADDYVSPCYLHNLINAAADPAVDLVFNYAVVHCDGKTKKENYPEKVIPLGELSDLFLNNDLIWHTSTWSKLFRRSIINNARIRYNENIHIGEDALFLFTYILMCNRIKVICTCDYNYDIRDTDSLTHRVNSYQSELNGLKQITSIVNRLKSICKISPELLNKFNWLTGSYKRRTLNSLYHNKIEIKERLNFLNSTDFADYIEAIEENSWQGQIYRWALANKHHKLYDLMRITVRILKK